MKKNKNQLLLIIIFSVFIISCKKEEVLTVTVTNILTGKPIEGAKFELYEYCVPCAGRGEYSLYVERKAIHGTTNSDGLLIIDYKYRKRKRFGMSLLFEQALGTNLVAESTSDIVENYATEYDYPNSGLKGHRAMDVEKTDNYKIDYIVAPLSRIKIIKSGGGYNSFSYPFNVYLTLNNFKYLANEYDNPNYFDGEYFYFPSNGSVNITWNEKKTTGGDTTYSDIIYVKPFEKTTYQINY